MDKQPEKFDSNARILAIQNKIGEIEAVLKIHQKEIKETQPCVQVDIDSGLKAIEKRLDYVQRQLAFRLMIRRDT